jgi:predicted nuclease of predicted toxin-antitoxin system
MPIALYMDHNVARQITDGLRLRQIDVITALEDGTTTLPDPELLDRATALERVLFTHDDDLVVEAHRRQREGTPFAGVIYVHQQHISIGECIRDLETIADAGEPEDMMSQVLFLPL